MCFSSSACYPQHTTGFLFLCSCLMFRVVNTSPSGAFSMSSLPQIAFCYSSWAVSMRQCVWPLSQLGFTGIYYIHLILTIKSPKRRMCFEVEIELQSQVQAGSSSLLETQTVSPSLKPSLASCSSPMD